MLRLVGMVIFLMGFGYFLALPFLANYQIDDQLASELFGSREELIRETSPDLINQRFQSKIAFMNGLQAASEKAAGEAQSRFGLNSEDIDKILELNADKSFDLEATATAFEDAGQNEKAEKIRVWMGWYNGQTLSEPELRPEMEAKAAEINAQIGGLDLSRSQKFIIQREATLSPAKTNPGLSFLLTFGLGLIGGLMHILPKARELPGIKNDGIWFNALNSRGWIGILLCVFLVVFYCVLYWAPTWVAEWAVLTDPLSLALTGAVASEWFLYGWLYTFAVVVMGIRYAIKYRHNRYQLVRTGSVTFFQIAFAFLLSNILVQLNLPGRDLKNIWPLDYSFFTKDSLNPMLHAEQLQFWAMAMFVLGVAFIVIGVPVLTYFYGKRWYCSWVCGCGGLAETAGDPFRQQSDKSLRAWKIERFSIHGVLVFAVVMTVAVLYTYITKETTLLGVNTDGIKQAYGFGIGSIFAGVVGTGFYPIMGNRVWCRFGCPLAAYLGIVQRFKSRFRITTNGGQCISCGNCSTYCEQGIDVRWYAQRGQNIVRASCVGCGVCSAVCPRGVLNLENGPEEGRLDIQAIKIDEGKIQVLS